MAKQYDLSILNGKIEEQQDEIRTLTDLVQASVDTIAEQGRKLKEMRELFAEFASENGVLHAKINELERNIDGRFERAAIAMCPQFEPADLIRSNSEKANYAQAFTDAAAAFNEVAPGSFWHQTASALTWADLGEVWVTESDIGQEMTCPKESHPLPIGEGFYVTDPASWPDKDVPVPAEKP
jgi:hypothetical protein